MADIRDSPIERYKQHRFRAKRRGIAFSLSFEQWWEIWEPYWGRRGTGSMEMCMCRTADKGGYEAGNVRIATVKENQHERALECRTAKAQIKYVSPARTQGASSSRSDWLHRRHAFTEYFEHDDEWD